MKRLFLKAKHYIWWYVFASEAEKQFYSLSLFGQVWTEYRNGKAKILNPYKVYK